MSELTPFRTAIKRIQSYTYLPSLDAIHLRVRQIHANANPEVA
jgi:hypothetical protein